MYAEFLSLCGFEPEEIKREGIRINRAFERLEIGHDDINLAINRIVGFFDIELLGIRKALGLWLRELIDMALAKEEGKKIVYASFPPVYQTIAAMASASEDIYCVIPEVVLSTTMNCIFSKMNPILEAAEDHGLGPGLAFCSFLQTRLGAIAKGIIPKPDLLVPSCLMCDQSPKVDELLHEDYGMPVAYIDHTFDSGGDKWPDFISPQRLEYLANEMEAAVEKFCQMFGYRMTERRIRQALDEETKLFRTAVEMYEFMKIDPIPISLKDLEIATRLSGACSRRALREGPDVLNILKKELKSRVDGGIGVMDKDVPRVMATMIPFDPSIVRMIEDLGLAVPVTSLQPTRAGGSPSSYASVWEEVAYSVLTRRGANYTSQAYMFQVKELAKQSKVDALILFHHIGCRQYNIWIRKAKEVIEEDLGIPVLVLEGDFCDFRTYNTKQMRIGLETFAQVVKNASGGRDDNP